jgi:hypothetical protein
MRGASARARTAAWSTATAADMTHRGAPATMSTAATATTTSTATAAARFSDLRGD